MCNYLKRLKQLLNKPIKKSKPIDYYSPKKITAIFDKWCSKTEGYK